MASRIGERCPSLQDTPKKDQLSLREDTHIVINTSSLTLDKNAKQAGKKYLPGIDDIIPNQPFSESSPHASNIEIDKANSKQTPSSCPWLTLFLYAIYLVICYAFRELLQIYLIEISMTLVSLLPIMGQFCFIGCIKVLTSIVKASTPFKTLMSQKKAEDLCERLNYIGDRAIARLIFVPFFNKVRTLTTVLISFEGLISHVTSAAKYLWRKMLCKSSKEELIGIKIEQFFADMFPVRLCMGGKEFTYSSISLKYPANKILLKYAANKIFLRLETVENSTKRLGLKHAHEQFNAETKGLFQLTRQMLEFARDNEKINGQESPNFAKLIHDLKSIFDDVEGLKRDDKAS